MSPGDLFVYKNPWLHDEAENEFEGTVVMFVELKDLYFRDGDVSKGIGNYMVDLVDSPGPDTTTVRQAIFLIDETPITIDVTTYTKIFLVNLVEAV